jgi:hypothetical protein
MLRIAVLAAVVMVLLGIAARAEARVRCDSGTTAFVEGKLRIFGVYFHRSDEFNEEWGFDEFACLGGARRPLAVGFRYSNTGTGSNDTPGYAYDGRRYLATYDTDDGEGGPSAHMSVIDLRTRRSFGFTNVACCEGVPAFRVARDGSYVALTPGEDLFAKRPGHRARTLSSPGAVPKDLAMHGGTVYWSEGGIAKSAALDGLGGGEALMLEPVRMVRRAGCSGRAIAAAGGVHVLARGERRVGCRLGGPARFPAGAAGDPRPRIVAGRWLLLRSGDAARVVDSRTGRAVARATGVAQATLMRDGTLAWIDAAGGVHARPPGGKAVTLPAAGASALAAARRAVYWTEAGVPKAYRPPSAARSASKPG